MGSEADISLKRCQFASSPSLRLVELDPKYVDVIVSGWDAATAGQATLEGDGTTFASYRDG